MKVLFSSASFKASYGGPAYSVARLAAALDDLGAEVAIWAPDGSAPEAGAAGGATALEGNLADALTRFGDPDVFHDSGLWLGHNHAIAARARRHGKPLFVSTRGMLEPWALRHRAWKKKLAWALYQRRDLASASGLHVTSSTEENSVAALSLGPPIILAPNGVDLLPVAGPATIERRIAFLGRLHPVKGLPLLIEAWGRVGQDGWTLEIAGPDEDDYRVELEHLIGKARGDIRLIGPLRGKHKSDWLRRSHVFVLPSHTENFGLAAAEALALEVPVIASKGTPWSALGPEGCGWHVETSVDGLSAALEQALALGPDERQAMGQRGRAFVERAFTWQQTARTLWAAYKEAIET